MVQPQPGQLPLDAAPAVPLVFHVEMFVLSVPDGTFAGNEEFWKRIDEQCVDVATSDLLQKNGIRVGVAPMGELEHFASFLDGIAPVQKLAIAGQQVKDAQIDMKLNIPEQAIFHYDKHNALIGKSFDRSDNILNVSFEPAPRKPGQLRLTLCPMVRALRKRMQFTQLNDTYEIQFVNPEMFYDLHFKADIPTDSFLIVTPSPDASRPSSVGNAFFIKNSPAERQEQVLIVVPQPYKVEQSAERKASMTKPE